VGFKRARSGARSANVNIETNAGSSPLRTARENDFLSVAQLLEAADGKDSAPVLARQHD
jgi:hypothetical protein